MTVLQAAKKGQGEFYTVPAAQRWPVLLTGGTCRICLLIKFQSCSIDANLITRCEFKNVLVETGRQLTAKESSYKDF